MEGVREKKIFPEGAAPALGNKLWCVEPPRTGGGGEKAQAMMGLMPEGVINVKCHWIKP